MVSFPQVSPNKTLCTPLPSSIRATCPAHLILLDFITRTILGEQYRSLSSSLCSFIHSPVTPSLLAPNIHLNTLFSNTLSLFPPLVSATKFHIHTSSTSQEIYSVLWNQKVHFRVHNSPTPFIPITSHINPLHALPF